MKYRARVLALLLSATMMFSGAPMTAFASELDSTPEEIVITEDSADVIVDGIVEDDTDEETGISTDTVSDGETDAESDTDTPDDELLEEETTEVETDELESAEPIFTVSSGVLVCSDPSRLTGANPIKKIDLTDDSIVSGTITTIPANLFTDNIYLESIKLPGTVKIIEANAFKGCTSLVNVAFENDAMATGASLGESAFAGCESLQYSEGKATFKIPANVATMGKNCFENCGSLCIVDFKTTSLTKIDDNTFSGCTDLENLKHLSAVTSLITIGNYAFQNTALDCEFKLPSSVTSIGSYAFKNCANIGNLNISNLGTVNLANNCFAESGITGIVLPDSYTTIATGLFKKCNSLESITIGGKTTGVTTISEKAFENCENLTSVTLNASVTTVADKAFEGCSKLLEVKIYQGQSDSNGSTIALDSESFPINSGLVLYGFGGEVESWAAKHSSAGVLYKSLYTGLQFDINKQVGNNGVTVKVNNGATLGSRVDLSPNISSGYALISMSHGPDKTLVDSTKSFIITGKDLNEDKKVQIDVAYANTSVTDPKSSAYTTYSLLSANNNLDISKSKNVYNLVTDGQGTQILIKAKNSGYGSVYSNPWLWTFKSANTKYVEVDAEGNIKPLLATTNINNGCVRVTATLKADAKTTLAMDVYVNGTKSFGDISRIDISTPTKITKTSETFGTETMQVVTTTKYWVDLATNNKNTRDFDVTVYADYADASGESAGFPYNWTTGNASIARVAKSTTTDGRNTIQLCGSGETTITAKYKGNEEKSISFVVRVLDITPYVNTDNIIVNTNATGAKATFELLQSYGGTVDTNAAPEVFIRDRNNWISKKADFGLEYSASDPDPSDDIVPMVISVKEDSSFYKNCTLTNLYAKVKVKPQGSSTGDFYYVPLSKVTITKNLPSPKLTTTGKVNTFYKGGIASTKEAQSSVTVNIAKLDGYTITGAPTLVSDAKSDPTNIFTNKFGIELVTPGDYSQVRIYLDAAELKDASTGKTVTSGYLQIPYQNGITVKVKVTVPTGRIAPSYALDINTVTTHAQASGQSFDVQLLDKSKRVKTPVDLTATTILTYTNASGDEFDGMTPSVNTTNDKITISMPAAQLTKNTKAVLELRDSTWATGEKFTYPVTVKVVTANPKLTIGTTNLSINRAALGSNSTTVEQKDEYITGFSVAIESAETKPATLAEADKLDVKFENGKIIASIKDMDDKPAVGSYKYTIKYECDYEGGAKFISNNNKSNVAFTVKVENKVPAIKLKSASFTLNDKLQGVLVSTQPVETATTTYTLVDMPAGTVPTLDLTGATITDSVGKTVYKDGTSKAISDLPVDFDFTNGKLSVFLKEKLNGTNHKYTIEGATVGGIALAKFDVTIVSINKTPTITLSPKGTINPIDSDSKIAYTLTVKNFNGTVDASNLQITHESNEVNNVTVASHTFDFVNEDGSKADLVVADYTNLVAKKYTLKVNYKFGDSYTSETLKINVTPTQKMPAVNLSTNKATVYCGNKAKTAKVKITPKNATGIDITGVEWSSKTPKELQKAFVLNASSFDSTNDELTISINNAAMLKKNTTYTLRYYIKCDHQITGSTGTEFTVTVTVK